MMAAPVTCRTDQLSRPPGLLSVAAVATITAPLFLQRRWARLFPLPGALVPGTGRTVSMRLTGARAQLASVGGRLLVRGPMWRLAAR